MSRASRHRFDVVIPNGGTQSAEFPVDSGMIVGVVMPAAWTAGNFGLQTLVGRTNAHPPVDTWADVVDNAGNPVVLTAPAAGEYVTITQGLWSGLGLCRLVASAAQGAARTVGVVVLTSD